MGGCRLPNGWYLTPLGGGKNITADACLRVTFGMTAGLEESNIAYLREL